MNLNSEEEREILNLIAIAFIACLGGIVKWVRNPYGTLQRTFFGFLTCVVTAAFVGMLSHFLLNYWEIDLSLQFAISGAAGYSGGVLLDATIPFLVNMAYKKVGLEYRKGANDNPQGENFNGNYGMGPNEPLSSESQDTTDGDTAEPGEDI